ncbi:UNVERIFIED_CONTAM: hypothetical protein PYX00_010836 [Menopon gallinae]|uniref:RUN domain-containing protein n=1 Tax=Menopon gallinae TaxID=328185 RepID=A0AAW2H722_9NEOP
MSEIKSHIGYARAWVRLALEKKLLSRHLRTLLSVTNLLKLLYKRNAFLRCEEEKEQFLYHLLSLNAVDYYCFTNTYLTTKLPYRVVVIPSRKASVSTTTANVWIAISGTNCETAQVPIPKGTLNFLFHHKNLGLLTSLRIGHDNQGLSPNWMVESVLVRCEVTGHTYRFPCGRYLGKSIDDGSTERLLVGELLKVSEPESVDNSGNTNTPPVQCRSPMMSRRDTRLSVAEVQHMIGDSVNNIVKYFHRFTTTRQRENCASLTPLLCGDMGLVHSLEQAFLYGFKATRLFGRNLYLWDYFTRVKEQFDSLLHESHHSAKKVEHGSLERCSLNNNAEKKDSEFEARPKERLNDHIPRSMTVRAISCDRRSGSQVLSSMSRDRERSADRGHVPVTTNTQIIEKYCELIQRIENSNRTFGKDGKFQRFICFAVRDHILHRMLTPLAASRPTLEMYEDNSFLRNSNLRSFLYDILRSLDEYDFFLESSITSGIEVT